MIFIIIHISTQSKRKRQYANILNGVKFKIELNNNNGINEEMFIIKSFQQHFSINSIIMNR